MSDELGDWQNRVENFGGRIGADDKHALWSELEKSNLGSARTLPTSEVNPVFPESITLAEMKLSKPIAVDVSFSYPNLIPDAAFFSPPSAIFGLDQGSGYVKITWGIPGAGQNSVKVDGGRGWRYPFVASYLRVEYIPSDKLSPPQWALKGSQPNNLQVQAMIGPASGAIAKPLTKTMWLLDVRAPPDPLPVSWGRIPMWSTVAHVQASLAQTSMYSVLFNPSDPFTGISSAAAYADGVAGQWPNFAVPTSGIFIPQQAVFVTLVNNGATAIANPSIMFELAL